MSLFNIALTFFLELGVSQILRLALLCILECKIYLYVIDLVFDCIYI
jgi:hypothetical protein